MADAIRITFDPSQMLEAFERMDMKHFKGVVRKALRQGANEIRKSEQEAIKRLFPGGKSYPRNPGRKAGVLRGKKYQPLYKDVKLSVYKSAKGANVSLYSQRKDNRWCVLMWLNAGTRDRTSVRTIRKTVRWGKYGKRHTLIQDGAGGMKRGHISPYDFFDDAAKSSMDKAQTVIAKNMEESIIKEFNKV